MSKGVNRGRNSSPSAPGRLRIIGGAWRGRRIDFHAVPDLRPTPDRVRETLFNWLQGLIEGSRCLDLFAGSGALGFEAASRGAAEVVMVELNPRAADHLSEQTERLGATQVEIVHSDARAYLKRTPKPFDIVFLDPPFGAELLSESFHALTESGALKPGAQVYLETESRLGAPPIPSEWKIVRSRKAGEVAYRLAVKISEP